MSKVPPPTLGWRRFEHLPWVQTRNHSVWFASTTPNGSLPTPTCSTASFAVPWDAWTSPCNCGIFAPPLLNPTLGGLMAAVAPTSMPIGCWKRTTCSPAALLNPLVHLHPNRPRVCRHLRYRQRQRHHGDMPSAPSTPRCLQIRSFGVECVVANHREFWRHRQQGNYTPPASPPPGLRWCGACADPHGPGCDDIDCRVTVCEINQHVAPTNGAGLHCSGRRILWAVPSNDRCENARPWIWGGSPSPA